MTIYGTIIWTDSAGGQHPVREATVEVWDKETLFPDERVKTVHTNSDGFYSATFDNNDGIFQGNRDIYIKVFADGPAHYVAELNSDTSYFISTPTIDEISNGDYRIHFTIGNGSGVELTDAKRNAERAFSISDARYM